MQPSDPVLKPIPILDLRPTQMTVGMREVEEKRRKWHDAGDKGPGVLGSHMIPTVLGPKSRHYVIDHHHLALALHLEGVAHVLVAPAADLSALDKGAFWCVMAHKNWMHAYDADGNPHSHSDLPKTLMDLVDDPFRSLAGELRHLGGYAKDTTLYSEFLWADFLRRHLKKGLVCNDYGQALQQAYELAKSRQAEYLPGWCGAT